MKKKRLSVLSGDLTCANWDRRRRSRQAAIGSEDTDFAERLAVGISFAATGMLAIPEEDDVS